MVNQLLEFIKQHKSGCRIYINFDDPKMRGSYVLGGVTPIEKNWFVYYSPWPFEQQDIHDCLATNFSFNDQQVLFSDQFGRKIIITPLDGFETNERKIYKDWIKDGIKSESIQKWIIRMTKERLENPKDYLGGYWIG